MQSNAPLLESTNAPLMKFWSLRTACRCVSVHIVHVCHTDPAPCAAEEKSNPLLFVLPSSINSRHVGPKRDIIGAHAYTTQRILGSFVEQVASNRAPHALLDAQEADSLLSTNSIIRA